MATTNPGNNGPEKICITNDEVARVDLSSAQEGATIPAAPEPAARRASSARPWIIVAAASSVVLLLLAAVIAFVFVLRGRDNVDEFAERWRVQQTEMLTQSPDVKAYIEKLHLLVTYKGARVESVKIATRDGSRNVGSDGSNISEIDMVVTYFWRGPVQDNGHTTVHCLFDFPSKTMKNSEVVETTALLTLDENLIRKMVEVMVPLMLGGN